MKNLFIFVIFFLFIFKIANGDEIPRFACECNESKYQISQGSKYFQEIDCLNGWIVDKNVNFNKLIVAINFDKEQKNILYNWISFEGTGSSFDKKFLYNYKKNQSELFFSHKLYKNNTAINFNFILDRYNLNSELTISIKAKDPKNPSLEKIDFEKGLKTLVNKYNCKPKVF